MLGSFKKIVVWAILVWIWTIIANFVGERKAVDMIHRDSTVHHIFLPNSWKLPFKKPESKSTCDSSGFTNLWIVKEETEIDTPFLCIWANIYGTGNFKKTATPAIHIKCHPSHMTTIQALLLTLISPSAMTPKIPGISFRDKWCSSLSICSTSQIQIMLAWFVTNLNFKHLKPLSKSQTYNHLAPSSQDLLTLLTQL